MKTFEFSIVASGLDPEADGFADRFFDAGCDDATLSFQKGRIVLDFARAAASLQGAIASAVEDVAKAGAKVDRIEPDPLVSLIDIAARSGLSRQAITQLCQGRAGEEFPGADGARDRRQLAVGLGHRRQMDVRESKDRARCRHRGGDFQNGQRRHHGGPDASS